ncbi:NtaA/DmoA family FMN-dependent monooxygenase [Pseudonocardia endophytica]|uniref:FMN-dependent oxidoreductase (Nitrilotriacetate monooxygenase family) n=1 Tax=Pseudonocardia endophytica TaxID=401976 RepID=A0A4R1HZJ3_PSEEN|nr:NtaA/DmoA family FMN-dependent monooxygenase [Pseudonocardia endophytica]TCK26330.1 FMN-dependent oxidoreductase (nitrilotriacetate monooxygenase family) [Pseudonocardia endophytica]
MTRTLHLNLNLLGSGRHDGAWRTQPDPHAFLDPAEYARHARTAERGLFDAVFLADTPALGEEAAWRPWHALDPTVVVPAMAAATSRIGFVATTSVIVGDPFSVARRFASLAHVTGGRTAWNVVTSQTPAMLANHGDQPVLDPPERYARAAEFVETVVALWDSFPADAVLADRERGVFADLDRVRPIGHRGRSFRVRGPLNVPLGPWGRPVIVQAGDSPEYRDVAARLSDAVFTVQRDLDGAVRFRTDLTDRARRHGRDVAPVVLPGLLPVLGSTEAEARRRKDELDDRLDATAELGRLELRLGIPPGVLDLDRPLPDDLAAGGPGVVAAAFVRGLVAEARRDGLTVRELLRRNPLGGHRVLVGTPEQVADEMAEWFRRGAADGFNLNMDSLPDGLDAFVDHVVPELQRRRLFRTSYAGRTLRDHLGETSSYRATRELVDR